MLILTVLIPHLSPHLVSCTQAESFTEHSAIFPVHISPRYSQSSTTLHASTAQRAA